LIAVETVSDQVYWRTRSLVLSGEQNSIDIFTRLGTKCQQANHEEYAVRGPWLTCPQPRPAARFRLYCLPHAGGGATFFHSLAPLLPQSIEMMAIQLPGREVRLAEPPHRRMASLVDALLEGIRESLVLPYAIFGHSMGALVAFELNRALRRQGLPLPRTTILSGRRPPTVPNTEPPLYVLQDDAFVDALVRRYDAIPPVIRNEPELMALFVPVLKADFETIETYVYQDEPPLPCAVAIYGGRDDPQTRQMDGWASLFSGPNRFRHFEGGHFYIASQRRAVAAALAEDALAGEHFHDPGSFHVKDVRG
jgi:medium-chain acyl-[acyl-carrier-protein] hydrolase